MIRMNFWLVLAIFAVYPVESASFSADPKLGSDQNPGTFALPFQSLAKCVGALSLPGDVCELRGGIYDAGGVVTATGTATNPVVIQARVGEVVQIRQGSYPYWVNGGGQLWYFPMGYATLLADQRKNSDYYERGFLLWQETRVLPEASFPNLTGNQTGMHPTILSGPGTSPTIIKSPLIPTGDLRGARAVVYPYLRRNAESRSVLSSGVGAVSINGGYFVIEPGKPFYLAGAKALIDQDWEWAFDAPTGRVWIQMPANMNPNTMKIRFHYSSTAFSIKSAGYVAIRNINFEGVVPVASANAVGVRYEGLSIHEPGILNFSDTAYDYKQLAGLVVRDGARVTGSTINGCNGRCIGVAGNGVVVENNTFSNGTRLGQLEGTISVSGSNSLIQKNNIENSGADGIGFVSTQAVNSVVRRNRVVNSGLQNWDAGGIGVVSHPAGPVTVDSNLILNVGHFGSGIKIEEASQQNIISHNVIGQSHLGILGIADWGWRIYSLKNNSIWNNTILPSVQYSVAVRGINDMTGSVIANNIMSSLPTRQAIDVPGSKITEQVSLPSDYRTLRSTWVGNLEAGIDPLLQTSLPLDYSLQPQSPAIDIGVVGKWAFMGGAPDAGAVEYGTKSWAFGPEAPPPVMGGDSILGFEDLSKWNSVTGDNSAYMKALTTDRVEGGVSMAITAYGYKVLESAPLTEAKVNGLGSVVWSMKVSSIQPNVWWLGQVQIMINCPSRNIWNANMGHIELTGLPANKWIDRSLQLPSYVVSNLQGATYSDLKVNLVLNVNPGAGPLMFDNMRFVP